MILRLIAFLGWILATLPRKVTCALCYLLGEILFFIPTQRRHILLSNLHHAFPDRPLDWHRKLAHTSLRRTLEMGALVLALPYFSKKQLRRSFSLSTRLGQALGQNADKRRPALAFVPHFSLMETLTTIPALYDGRFKPMAVIFRPLDHPRLDQWIQKTRERWGIRLLSRKAGFDEAIRWLRAGNTLGILVDQNAGKRGLLTTFFGRLCSTTHLHGLLSEKFEADLYAFYTNRKAFWQAEIDLEPLNCPKDKYQIVLKTQSWLEQKLRQSDTICADWLWLHDRWRTQYNPRRRLRIQARKNILQETLSFYQQATLPKKTRIWIGMPNWLGDIIIALPLIHALQKGRPDAEITLLAQPQFIPLLKEIARADRLVLLPSKGAFGYAWRLRNAYPDTYLLFTNSLRGDLQAWLTRAPQRFGMLRPGKPRPLLTHAWKRPKALDEARHHQTYVSHQFLSHFGLEVEPDTTPLQWRQAVPRAAPSPLRIGLICGSENDPSKRWPVSHWRRLIEKLLEKPIEIVLFGTTNDRPITQAVAAGFDPQKVANLGGKTPLVAFAEQLLRCHFVICSDTGGMHLANALGVSVVALFGPTNPIRTVPLFDAPAHLLQPPHCPPTGGCPIGNITPEQVLERLTF